VSKISIVNFFFFGVKLCFLLQSVRFWVVGFGREKHSGFEWSQGNVAVRHCFFAESLLFVLSFLFVSRCCSFIEFVVCLTFFVLLFAQLYGARGDDGSSV
jgi:hypothetical protein